MPKIAVPKENRHVYTASDITNMVEKAPTKRDKALIALYYIFGTRRNEPFFMHKDDMWIEGEWFYLKVKREKVPRKMVLPRVDTLKVKLGTPFLGFIIDYLKDNETEFPFLYHPNHETSAHKVYLMVKVTNPNAWIHLFRHTRAERFREAGYSDAELMAWFGWTDARTPSRYVHPARKTIEDMGGCIE